jgi:hypothetical protein
MTVAYFFVAKAKKENIMPNRSSSSVSETIITADSIKQKKKVIVETYSRVVGFYRPVNQWNLGKKEEYSQRVEYSVFKIRESISE